MPWRFALNRLAMWLNSDVLRTLGVFAGLSRRRVVGVLKLVLIDTRPVRRLRHVFPVVSVQLLCVQSLQTDDSARSVNSSSRKNRFLSAFVTCIPECVLSCSRAYH